MTAKRLPDFNTLVRLSQRGLSDDAIGKRYDCTGQAVNKALVLGNYRRTTKIKLANALIPWDVLTTKGEAQAGQISHHNTYPSVQLRCYMRVRLADETLTEANRINAMRFERRLRRDNVVLDYSREEGFSYVPRTEEDGNLVLRWPADETLPEDPEHLRAVTLDPLN